MVGDGVKRVPNPDMAIEMDGTPAVAEVLEGGCGQRLKGSLLLFKEVGDDLAAGGAMDAQAGDVAVPAAQVLA